MAFITRCWRKCCPPEPAETVGGVGLQAWRMAVMAMLACVSLNWLPSAHAQSNIELQGLRAERQEGALVLSGKWRYELSASMQEALTKGVALHFVSEAEVTRERWYFYDKRIAQAQRYYRLSYLPLTQRWRLNSANQPMATGGLGVSLAQTFDTLEEASAAMQRISQWRVAVSADVESDVSYTLEMKFRLDLSQLPRPLQIGAVGQNDWSLNYAKRMPLVVEPAK